ncbi:unnamed protein product [Phytophthora fragariaefolia]|uniref:Unnamed protein product n=1 Tax=Phytophthora fragariaefolia TaxID=1490495 RepID=A0A9W6TMH6_9STRA|nr:unnamed protein product [Phytophthora fragariaefolia]
MDLVVCRFAKYSGIPSLSDDFEEVDELGYGKWSTFRGPKELHIDLCPAEVEAIEGMSISPTASLGRVPGLYTHADGSTTTKLREESKSCFGRSATSSFFAFLPLSLWKQVVVFSNEYAITHGNSSPNPIERTRS